ncbi:hypothetical protein RN001_005804 [Aquatica leii]|uniref:DDE Tnp4 domain-containing protein n=1 Tax=Aquatica leii TaxID=1421715 RepID=A0AAN7Q8C2_9COLE|nr:hypothetical protein RN001_005804 [Aquatica leii]
MNENGIERVKRKTRFVVSALLQVLDSDSDEDLITMVYNEQARKRRKARVAIKNYVENVVSFYADDFKCHFRLRKDTFEHLLQILGPSLKEQNATGVGRHTYPPEKQLLVALSMLANQEVYRLVAEKFDISKSTAWLYVKKVCTLLVDLSGQYICWPTGQKLQQIKETFKERQGFPDVIGAIDGTHIPISPPLNEQAAYCNRNRYHSIILQGVCDTNYMFTDVFTGYPGSVHDARVFANSPLAKRIGENASDLFPNNTHLWEIQPISVQRKKNYNYKHSSTRVYIEQSFAFLKGRFRILKHVNVYNTAFISKIIVACCVLHNICIQKNDNLETEEHYEDITPQDYYCTEKDCSGFAKRDEIADKLISV